jgi:hypothetical protein
MSDIRKVELVGGVKRGMISPKTLENVTAVCNGGMTHAKWRHPTQVHA